MVVLLLAISAHEAAHAWMSYKFGDDTGRLLGRITLNPMAHTHPIATLLIPIATCILGSPGTNIPLIGWGKPTPVNPLRWRNKDLANVMVSLARILANIFIASIAFLILKIIIISQGRMLPESVGEQILLLLEHLLTINGSLDGYTLVPFHPL